MKCHFFVIQAYAFPFVMQVVTYKDIFTWRKINFSILWKLAFLFFYLVLYSCSEREHLVNRICPKKRNHAIDNQKVFIFRFLLNTKDPSTYVWKWTSSGFLFNLFSRHYPNWTGQAENFRLEMRPSQGSSNLRVHLIVLEYSLLSPNQVHRREGRRHIRQDSLCKLHIINMMNSFGYGIRIDTGMFVHSCK